MEHDFVDVPRGADFFAGVTLDSCDSTGLNDGFFVYFGLFCISQALNGLARVSLTAIIALHVDDLASDQHVH